MRWRIPYAGEIYEFDDSRLTRAESILQKRLTGGLSPVATERARLDQLDDDAWLAALVIARRRIGLSDEAAEDINDDEFDVLAIPVATQAAVAAETKPAKARTRKAATPPAEEPATT